MDDLDFSAERAECPCLEMLVHFSIYSSARLAQGRWYCRWEGREGIKPHREIHAFLSCPPAQLSRYLPYRSTT